MKALVIGATGAVGKDLVQQLIDDSSVERVDIFVRREVKIPSAKLVAHVVDFDHPETWADQLQGDVLFSCMGTTIKAAGSQEAQWKVDYTYQYEAAKAAKANDVPTYVLVSAIGANLKAVRLPGTEHMDKAYHQKRYHFIQSLWGMLIGLIPCLIGAGIYAW